MCWVFGESHNLVLRKVTREKSYFQPPPQPVMLSLIPCPSEGRQGIQDTCEILVGDFSFNDDIKKKKSPNLIVIWKSDQAIDLWIPQSCWKPSSLWRDRFLAKPNTFNCGILIYSHCCSRGILVCGSKCTVLQRAASRTQLCRSRRSEQPSLCVSLSTPLLSAERMQGCDCLYCPGAANT